MAQISCRDLSLGYENHVLLKDLSFDVNKGEYLCIVGENGAGKTTLMRTILGLQKPLGGSIAFEGEPPYGIGYLPQQNTVQRDFPASVREVVTSGFQAQLGKKLFYNKEQKAAALKQLERLGAAHLADRCFRDLSGGQQQRVLLARALCAGEKMLLLDEPVAGLDPRAMTEMYQLVDQLHHEGITVIMISHDIHAAMAKADHILHIGRTLFYGTPEQYRQSTVGRRYLEEGGAAV